MPQGITIFCGSASGVDPQYIRQAELLGQAIAHAGLPLIYGGGRMGLMGAIGRSCRAAGGHTVCVIPQFMVDRGWNDPDASETIITCTRAKPQWPACRKPSSLCPVASAPSKNLPKLSAIANSASTTATLCFSTSTASTTLLSPHSTAPSPPDLCPPTTHASGPPPITLRLPSPQPSLLPQPPTSPPNSKSVGKTIMQSRFQ